MSHDPRYLDVAVPAPLRRSFAYLAPAHVDPAALKPGIRLRVPFGRRILVGVLLGSHARADVDPGKVKIVHSILDKTPALTPSVMKLCSWAAGYYHHPIGEVLASALPALLRQGESLTEPLQVLRATTAASTVELRRAPRQAALLALLLESPAGLTRAQLARADTGAHVIRALIDKGLAAWHAQTTRVAPAFDSADLTVDHGSLRPSTEQLAAIQAITAAGSVPSLLFGITGSGKTEVYLRLIESVLRAGKQALLLVPEIGLTPQTVQRFSERFSVPVVTLHSGLSHRERLEAWRAARGASAGIVIGTRSAIFTPLDRPGLIIVDEEHDASFKQQDGFRYHARDLAVMRSRLEAVPIVLGSATPSLESWHNAATGKYHRATLASRPGQSVPARYRVINIRDRPLTEGFATDLLEAIGAHLERGNQTLVFLNRRGFAPALLCRHCGYIAECRRCDARMTLHAELGLLICHHCASQLPAQRHCPQCGGEELIALGAGTQRVEAIFKQVFPAYPVLRIDRDSTRRKHAMDDFMSRIATGSPCILVGTQLIAKGHHFPDVTLVAIADMDGGFYSADYKATERMAQLILQVGGRAGRAEKPGVVAIQTHFPDQEIFRTLIDQGYGTFADQLLAERAQHELPPFYFQALLRAEASDRDLPMKFLEDIDRRCPSHASVMLLGPVPSPMERRAGRFRAQLLLTAKRRAALQSAIESCIEAGENSPLARKVRWSIDVDPVDLF